MRTDRVMLSIITPTYNRGNLLGKCYESLLRQTDPDFEWIIVDDGSTDDTAEVVSGFVSENFRITYIQKENGGKHTALNAAHPYIHGEYVLILDSDDHLTDNAVSQIRGSWNVWEDNLDVGIITLLKGYSVDDPTCTSPTPGVPVDILRHHRRIVHSSDCCEVIRTELFKQYPFPVFEGERFLSEGVLWNRVAMTHQCVYINEVIYICEYLEGGLTKSGKAMRIRNPLGGMYNSEICMQPKNYVSQRVKKGMLYTCYGFFAGLTPGRILDGTAHKIIAAACMLPGWALYLYWKRTYL